MRGGTGRLPRRDDERDPGLYKFLLYLSPDVYMEAERFSSRPGQAGSRFVQPGIPPQPGHFLPCKHLLPGRDGRRDDFGVLK